MLKKIPQLAIIVIGLCLLLSALHFFNLITPAEAWIKKVFSPIQGFFYSASNKLFSFEEKQDVSELSKQNADLEKQINDLLAENTKLKNKLESYRALDEQFKFITEKEYRAIPARILTRSSDQTAQSIIINQGTDQGLIKGLPVIIGGGILVGKITDIDTDTAIVTMITDQACKFTAETQSQNPASGIVSGQHGLSVKMELIPQTEQLTLDQLVITAGLEENVPQGLIIGTIEKIESIPGELWQNALITPKASLKGISIVTVILPQ